LPAFNRLDSNGAFISTPARDTYNGSSANAFGNYLHDFTVEIGEGNAGAMGVQYQTSNYGSLRNVTIKSLDPARICQRGLDLAFEFPGPMLVQNLTVDGFDIGVLAAPQESATTFEGLTLVYAI